VITAQSPALEVTAETLTDEIRISDRQLEVLTILGRKTQPVEWGDVWDSYAWGDLNSTLAMTNFGRVCDALTRKELVAMDADNMVSVTERGRLALRMSSAGILAINARKAGAK
jgi:hypothetical protein